MHPVIKKFWEEQGYSITVSNYTYNKNGKILNAALFIISNEIVSRAAGIKYDDDTFVYHIDNKNLSEKEALSIIKLKAFW